MKNSCQLMAWRMQGVGIVSKKDLLRNQEIPSVFGYELDRKTLSPIRKLVLASSGGDYGADPLGDGTFRMVPSGDIVDFEERCRRLGRS